MSIVNEYSHYIIKWIFMYILIFNVAHWDTSYDSFANLVCKEKVRLSVLMLSVICLLFSQLVDQLCNTGIHLVTLLNILMPMY